MLKRFINDVLIETGAQQLVKGLFNCRPTQHTFFRRLPVDLARLLG